MTEKTGQCLCGAVSFSARDVGNKFGACHCDMCRRWTGSALLGVTIKDKNIVWRGEEHIAQFQSTFWAKRGWCKNCGTNLFFKVTLQGDHSDDTEIPLGLFDDPSGFTMTNEIYIDHKPDSFAYVGSENRKLMTRADCVEKFGVLDGKAPVLPDGELPEPSVLLENDELRLRIQVGTSDTLVVAFTGIGHKMGSSLNNEFAGTASQRGENSVIFVADMLRSWFSRPGMMETISREVVRFAKARGIKRIMTIGNSMGGYGALLLPAFAKVDVAIGMSPQLTMHHKLLPEKRWRRFRPNMYKPNLWSLNDKLVHETKYYALFGSDQAEDMLHSAALKPHTNLVHRNVAGAGHNLSGLLRQAGLLGVIVDAMLAGDDQTVDELLKQFETRTESTVNTLPTNERAENVS